MLDLAAAFGEIAASFSAAFGGPYWPGRVLDRDAGSFDAGGSWVSGSAGHVRCCSVQIDTATEAMRQANGFSDGDVRFIILGLDGPVDTDARVEVLTGPRAGSWSVSQLERDPAGIGWVGKGRIA